MKIYNELVLQWNKKTEQYDRVLYEDSFEYHGEIMEASSHDVFGACCCDGECIGADYTEAECISECSGNFEYYIEETCGTIDCGEAGE